MALVAEEALVLRDDVLVAALECRPARRARHARHVDALVAERLEAVVLRFDALPTHVTRAPHAVVVVFADQKAVEGVELAVARGRPLTALALEARGVEVAAVALQHHVVADGRRTRAAHVRERSHRDKEKVGGLAGRGRTRLLYVH